MISAKIIADSVSEDSSRITTFEIEYPRFIHCFDSETEILSKVGNEDAKFRSFEAVFALGAKVAQYSAESGNITFVYPEKTVKQRGTFNMVSFDKKKFSMCVTDKHRVYLDKRTTDNKFKQTEVLAEDLLGNYGTVRIPQAGWELQHQVLSDEEISLIAWYVADGYRENHNTSNFHFRKERKLLRVTQLLTECGIDFKTFTHGNDYVIRFDNPSWVEECYTEGGHKKLPFVATQMTQDCYEKFKLALLESDGNVDNMEYNTTSITLAEQIQTVALLHGDAMNIRKYHQEGYSGLYKQKFKDSNYISLRQDKDLFEINERETTVYCVTVPSSFVVVRRKGVAYVSGNCELMTHRLFSRNAASSRAIPIDKMMDQVVNNPAMPVSWGKNQSGMQAKESFESSVDVASCKFLWRQQAARNAVEQAKKLQKFGLHKQIVNRLLEPFQLMKTVVTATEFDNFFWLRCHTDAQPEIHVLAEAMFEEYTSSVPQLLKSGEWHLPYVKTIRPDGLGWDGNVVYCKWYKVHNDKDGTHTFQTIPLEEALKVSASCCAQVSYRTLDDSVDKAIKIYNSLVTSKPVHASPLEHQATPMDMPKHNPALGIKDWEDGITHCDKEGNLWSGNFKGWVQHRQLIQGNTCWDYEGEIK